MTIKTVVVDARASARSLDSLQMKCDSKEMPLPLNGLKPDSRWLVGVALFTGKAATNSKAANPSPAKSIELGGSAALAIAADRVIGIVSPRSPAEPALWFAWPIDELTIEGVGAQGLFKKRPKVLKVSIDGGLLEMTSVMRLMPNSGAAQPGQEGALMSALGA